MTVNGFRSLTFGGEIVDDTHSTNFHNRLQRKKYGNKRMYQMQTRSVFYESQSSD